VDTSSSVVFDRAWYYFLTEERVTHKHKDQASHIAAEYLRIRDIKWKFASLLSLGHCKLQGKIIDMRKFRVFLAPFYSPEDNSNDSLKVDASNFIDKVLGTAKDLSDVFVAFCRAGLLDFKNYDILRSIIKEYASDDGELTQQMEEYVKEVAGYILVTKMKTYVDAVFPQDEDSEADPELFDTLSSKVGENVTECTLQYVKDLWDSLALRFKIPQSALLFKRVAEGCIEITWNVPSHLTNFVISRARENTEYFRKKKVLRLAIANRYAHEVEVPIINEEKRDPWSKVSVSLQWY